MEEYRDADATEFETVFVVADFHAPVFDELRKADCRVLGPPVVMHCARKGEVRIQRKT